MALNPFSSTSSFKALLLWLSTVQGVAIFTAFMDKASPTANLQGSSIHKPESAYNDLSWSVTLRLFLFSTITLDAVYWQPWLFSPRQWTQVQKTGDRADRIIVARCHVRGRIRRSAQYCGCQQSVTVRWHRLWVCCVRWSGGGSHSSSRTTRSGQRRRLRPSLRADDLHTDDLRTDNLRTNNLRTNGQRHGDRQLFYDDVRHQRCRVWGRRGVSV